MLRLRTLGGAVVERDGIPLGGPAAQRKSLAVLALLAPAGDRGVSRDKLLAHVWPETEPDRAGHRLTQVLYALRRDLGVDDLFLGSTELRLNPKRIASDVDEFTAARRAGDLERAVSLYGGPFLDGFFLSEAVEFERWVENERAGFAREYAEALETLAAAAAMRGDHRAAAEWWQALADHDPLSSRTTVHLMTALAAAGRRADAIEQARSYQETIQRELEAAPNPAVLALADELRQRPSALQDGEGMRAGDISIAVLPFASTATGPAHDFFADGLADELMSGLARLSAVRVAARVSVTAFRGRDLDARKIGQRLQVQALLEGSVRQADDRIRLTARLVDVRSGWHVWSETYERQVKDAFAVQDELASLIVKEVDRELARMRASRSMAHG
jgi:TolB-like protein